MTFQVFTLYSALGVFLFGLCFGCGWGLGTWLIGRLLK